MKKVFLFLTLILIFSVACRHSVTVSGRYVSAQPNTVQMQGNYMITSFVNLNTNADNTAAFDGYIFMFGNDGKVNTKKDNISTSGSYTKTYTTGDNLEIAFNFSGKPLNNLNGNWWVKSISETSIELADASTADVLEFTAR